MLMSLVGIETAIRILESDVQVEVAWTGRRWVFPRAECVLLPMRNTTAESLARWLGRQLLDALQENRQLEPQAIRVELEESEGHAALFTWRRD